MSEVEIKEDEFSQCTEYCYNELGKLDQAPLLTKKEKKKTKDKIMFRFWARLDVINAKESLVNRVEKVNTKECKSNFNKNHSVGFAEIIRKPFMKINNAIGKSIKAVAQIGQNKVKSDVLVYDDAGNCKGQGSLPSPALEEGKKVEETRHRNEKNSGEKNSANM